MPADRIKNPDLFPRLWHLCLKRAYDDYQVVGDHGPGVVIGTHPERLQLCNTRRRYRAFLKSLADHPLHSLGHIPKECRTRLEIQQAAFSRDWFLTVRLLAPAPGLVRAGVLSLADALSATTGNRHPDHDDYIDEG